MATESLLDLFEIDQETRSKVRRFSEFIETRYPAVVKQWKEWVVTIKREKSRGRTIQENLQYFFQDGLSRLLHWGLDISVADPLCLQALNSTTTVLIVDSALEDLGYLFDNCSLNEQREVVLKNISARSSTDPVADGGTGIVVGDAARDEFDEALSALLRITSDITSRQALFEGPRPDNPASRHVHPIQEFLSSNPRYRPGPQDCHGEVLTYLTAVARSITASLANPDHSVGQKALKALTEDLPEKLVEPKSGELGRHMFTAVSSDEHAITDTSSK